MLPTHAGFFACGATLANLLLSGVGQVLTAALTRWVLRRRLTTGQLAGIAFVSLGLAVRAAPAAYFELGAARPAAPAAAGPAAAPALSQEQLTGAALVSLAALLYSLLGVAYEKLLKGSEAPPPNAEIMWSVSILGGWPEPCAAWRPRRRAAPPRGGGVVWGGGTAGAGPRRGQVGAPGTGRGAQRSERLRAPGLSSCCAAPSPPCWASPLWQPLLPVHAAPRGPPTARPLAPRLAGFLASAAYQALYVLPRWDALVGRPLAASPASPRYVALLLAVFGSGFNLHMLAQVCGARGRGKGLRWGKNKQAVPGAALLFLRPACQSQ